MVSNSGHNEPGKRAAQRDHVVVIQSYELQTLKHQNGRLLHFPAFRAKRPPLSPADLQASAASRSA